MPDERDRIEAAIRHIQTAVDVDPWAVDIAVAAMEKQISSSQSHENDTISRRAAIDAIDKIFPADPMRNDYTQGITCGAALATEYIKQLPSAQPESKYESQPESKYEYHYDHTDCIWFRPEARNRCPSTCAQYRDGWNDAMNYVFRDGKGYRPYRRDQKYEG